MKKEKIMSEKRFLNFICIEGTILTVLGLCILILPKLTSLTFGVMLASAFIAYGAYKVINAIINRHFSKHFICEMLLGIFLAIIGILLFLVPKISLLWLIALTGVYFLIQSIAATAFIAQIRSVFNNGGCKYLSATVLFLAGLMIILGLPVMSFWVVAMISGIAFLIKGMAKITLALVNKNSYNNI